MPESERAELIESLKHILFLKSIYPKDDSEDDETSSDSDEDEIAELLYGV